MTAAASSNTHGFLSVDVIVPSSISATTTTTTTTAVLTNDDMFHNNANVDDDSMVLDDTAEEAVVAEKNPSLLQQQSLDFTLPKCIMPPSHEFDPVQTFVAKTILEQHQLVNSQQQQGNTSQTSSTEAYRGLLDLLRHRNDIIMLTYILLALRTSDHGNTLNRITNSANQHARLIHQIVRFNPFFIPSTTTTQESSNDDIDYSLTDAHLSLLIAIVSKKSVFLVPAMGSLWRMLSTLHPQQSQSQSQQTVTEDGTATRSTVVMMQQQPIGQTQRLHAALATLIRLVPKAKTEFFGIIHSNCPYPTRHLDQITWYYQQALHTLNYISSIRNLLLQLMIQQCLQIDIEIKITDLGHVTLDTDHNDNHDHDIFEINPDDSRSTTMMRNNKRYKKNDNENEQKTVDEMADKLDSLMLLLLEYVEQQQASTSSTTLSSSSTPTCTVLHEIYLVFWDIFERSILCTHKSKFVQFILLHICSLEYQIIIHNKNKNQNNNNKINNNDNNTNNNNSNHDDNNDHDDNDDETMYRDYDDNNDHDDNDDETMYRDYAIKLVNIIMDPYRSSVTRQASACYLASFISRCKCVGPETVCEAICALLRWAETYIQQTTTTTTTTTYDDDDKNNNNTSLGVMTTTTTTTPTTMTLAPDARNQCNLHALFYTICQAAFYIICFRGKEAIQFSRKYTNPNVPYNVQPRELIDIRMPRWTRLVGHTTFQPLRHCLESVRLEFLHVARLFHLVEPSVLERLETMAQVMMNSNSDSNGKQSTASTRGGSNKGGRLSLQRQRKKPGTKIATAAMVEKERRNGGVGGLGQGTNPLDSFFPFDPYLLCRSHAYIEPHYNHWIGSLSPEDYDGSHDYEDYDDEDVDVDGVDDDELDSVTDDLDVDAASIEDDDDDEENDNDATMMSHEDNDDDDDEDDENDNSDLDEDVVDEFASTSLTSSHSPMVLTPTNTTSASSSTQVPDYMAKREELRKAWSEQHNLENGSW